MEVNGVPCPSCPTRDLPENELLPGDIIRIDALVADWDDDPTMGVCTGSPNHGFGQLCATDDPSACQGMHCLGSTGIPCQNDGECFPFPACVPSQCAASPQVAAFQWTLDSASLTSGARGSLSLAVVECDPADCVDVSAGGCPCAQFHQSVSECTCAFNHSCSVNGTCGPAAAAFMEPARSDFLFFNQQSFLAVNTGTPDIQFLGALTGFDAAVPGAELRFNLGSVMLKVSDDAGGPFTVRMVADPNLTFLNDRQPMKLIPQTFSPATINVPRCAFVSCDDFDDCTVDTMDPLTCVCTYAEIPCPIGQRCDGGACMAVPLCLRVLSSAPRNCAVDARVPHPPDNGTPAQGVDRFLFQFDSVCDAARLRMSDFAVAGGALPSGPVIASIQALGSAVEVVLDALIPTDQWFCITFLPTGNELCAAHLPGDVNGDQRALPDDLVTLTGWLGRMPMMAPPLEHTDLDRSSTTDAADLIAAIDLLNGAGSYAPRMGMVLPVKCPSR